MCFMYVAKVLTKPGLNVDKQTQIWERLSMSWLIFHHHGLPHEENHLKYLIIIITTGSVILGAFHIPLLPLELSTGISVILW